MYDVLIVEDNGEYRESLRRLLVDRFPEIRVVEAKDAKQCLRAAQASRFDLIFMDLRLPDGNGLGLTRTIRAAHPQSRICVLSAHFILEYREAALRHGADHFMVKGESSEIEIVALLDCWIHA